MVKKEILKLFPNPKRVLIDIKEGELKKSDVTHLLNMSDLDKSNKKVNDKWNMDSHKLFWHLDRVEAWQRGERVATLHLDMGISSGCNMACTFFVMELFKIETVLVQIQKKYFISLQKL